MKIGLIRSTCAAGWVLGLACWASACSSASNGAKPGEDTGGDAAQAEPDAGGGGAMEDGSTSSADASTRQDGSIARTDGGGGGGADAQSADAQPKDASVGGDGSLVYPPFSDGGTIDDGVAQLNLYRALVGLPPVTLDPVSSAACSAHLAYLICAADAGGGTGYLEHMETGFPTCATDGGEPAGTDSDLAWGEQSNGRTTTGQSFGQAVDVWINGLYHRTPLLDPGLMRVGGASEMGYNCLDYAATGNRSTVKAVTPVLFPPDGTTDVPLTFEGNEGPCPTATNPLNATSCAGSGFIVSANWYAWSTGNKSAIGGVTSATLTDTQTQTVVPLFTYYADTVTGHDPAPGYVRNEIALVPQANLAAHHTFTVDINATISGQPTALSWSFTTGARAP